MGTAYSKRKSSTRHEKLKVEEAIRPEVCILGHSRVGKSYIARYLSMSDFIIHDTEAYTDRNAYRDDIIARSSIFILVFKLQDRYSFHQLHTISRHVKDLVSFNPSPTFIIYATNEGYSPKVSQSEIESLCSELQAEYFTSAASLQLYLEIATVYDY